MRVEDLGDRSRNFEVVVSRIHWLARRIVDLTGLGVGVHRWMNDRRNAGQFVGWYRCRRRMLSLQREGDGHIYRVRQEVVDELLVGLVMLRTWRLGEVDWKRVEIGRVSRRPCGYVRIW